MAAPDTARWCERDSDCFSHERCSLAHNGRCVSKQLPARPSFGLSGRVQIPGVSGPGHEIPWEFKGCEIDVFDPATGVSRIHLESKLYPLYLNQLVYALPYQGACAATCAPQAYCDTVRSRCSFARTGRWVLSTPSSLGLDPLESTFSIDVAAQDPSETLPHLALYWPCGSTVTTVHERDQFLDRSMGAPGPIPSERNLILPAKSCPEIPNAALGAQHFDLSWSAQPSERHAFQAVYLHEDSEQARPSFDLDLDWKSRAAPLLLPRHRPGELGPIRIACTRDADCKAFGGTRSTCAPDGRCRMPMTRVPAGRVHALTAETQVLPLSPKPRTGPLEATLMPRGPGLAQTRVTLDRPEELATPPERSHRICAPLWKVRPNHEKPLQVVGRNGDAIGWGSHSPLPLLPGRMVCNAHDLASPTSSARDSCKTAQRPQVQLLADLSSAGRASFEAAHCASPVENSPNFTLRLPTICDPAGRCEVKPYETPAAGPCYDYELTLARPAASVFRSIRTRFAKVHCPPQAPEPLRVERAWELRPVLRGRVHAAGSPSNHLYAEILAERLQDGEQGPVGPFFFHQQVIPSGPRKGQFALPVEPGRYVITALAHNPLLMGPAPFRVVDLRAGASALDDPQTQLHLQTGSPVQVQIHAPDPLQGVRVRPIDLGSWVEDPRIPDLNDPHTCFPNEIGCKIRMLTTPVNGEAQEISADYRSVLRWTSRQGGPHECP